MASIYGLTGQTGAGKSTVREIFGKLGAAVIDADTVAHEITDENIDCLAEIALAFSCLVLTEKGKLNRKALGKMVFSDPKKLQALNKIIFPYIKTALFEKAEALEKNGAEYIVIDGATLIEMGCSDLCSKLVSVTAEEEVRFRRIVARDKLSEEDAKKRIASQKNEDFYVRSSDYVIRNNGSIEELKNEAKAVYSYLKSESSEEEI